MGAEAASQERGREEVDPSSEVEEGEIDDEAVVSSPGRRPASEPVQPHPLEHAWTFWFDNPTAKAKQAAWGSSMRPVHTFSTVEDFWRLPPFFTADLVFLSLFSFLICFLAFFS